MKIRETAYEVLIMNRHTGVMAPSVFIYAENAIKAANNVAKTNTLVKRFPEHWMAF